MCSETAAVIQEEDQVDRPQMGRPLRPLEDEELVARAQKNDEWATEELVRRYQQKAYAIAYHMCSEDREEAQDCTQEAFLRAFRNIKGFRSHSSFYTWFYRILVNTCLDGRRRRRRREKIFSFWRTGREKEEPARGNPEEGPETGKVNDPVTVLSGKQLSLETKKALMALSERQRLAFQFKVLHEMSIREIAQAMGLTEGTVKSHLFRATRFMREALKDWTAT